MADELVRVERRGRAALVTIDRPDRANSLSRAVLLSLGQVGKTLAAEPDLGAVVLTGAGDKAFCAGADLKERRDMTLDDVRRQLELYQSELRWLESLPVPSIAALNGAAVGGGLELALLCDLRVSAPHATLGLPETRLGIIPGAGGTQRLPRLVGPAKAQELILLGHLIDAREALRIGLVNRVSPPGVPVVEDTLSFIQPILDGAPIAQKSALLALRAAETEPLDGGLARERAAYEACLTSEDRLEALRAFQEKRPPRFSGR